MGIIADAFKATFADGPSASPAEVEKAAARRLGGTIESQVVGAAAGLIRASSLPQLNARPGTRVGQPGEVTAGADRGAYSWSGSAWVRVGNLVTDLIDESASPAFSVVDDAGFEALRVDEDGLHVSSASIQESGHDGFEVRDPAGNVGLRVGADGPEVSPYYLAKVSRFDTAGLDLPAEQVVVRSGRIEVNNWQRPRWGNPYVQGKATISQDTADASLNYRNYQIIPSTEWHQGRWWTIWYGLYSENLEITPVGEAAGTFAIAAYSDDLGETWTEAFYIVPPNRVTDRVWDVSVTSVGGKLFISYVLSGNGGLFDGYQGAFGFYLMNPKADVGRLVFSQHEFMGYGLTYNFFDWGDTKCIPRSYFPVLMGSLIPEERGRFICRLNTSAMTFEDVMKTPFEVNEADWSYDERQIVQSQYGGLIAQWRSNSGIYESRFDGAVWSAPALWTKITPHPISKHYLGRSPSGRLAMALNNASGRSNLVVAFSEDDGQTWPEAWRVPVYAGNCSYPTGAFDDSGNFLVTYDAERGPPNSSIRCSVINEQSVIDGAPQFTNHIISKLD